MVEKILIYGSPRNCHGYLIDPKDVKKMVEEEVGHKAFSIHGIYVEFHDLGEQKIITKYSLNKVWEVPFPKDDIVIEISLKQFVRKHRLKKIL